MVVFNLNRLLHFRKFCVLIALIGSGPLRAELDDLGECAGYLPGSIESAAISPPNLGWEALDSEGPSDGPCIVSGLLWNARDPSIAQLTLTGPGLLTFEWSVSSISNDGWLSCELSKLGGPLLVGRISGDTGLWETVNVFVPQGSHTVSWIYRKTTPNFGGDDAGKVANVSFTAYPAAPQSFDDYKTAYGVTGNGDRRIGSRRLDASWHMGLAPNASDPIGTGLPIIDGANTRFRFQHSLSATGLMTTTTSPDLANWVARYLNPQVVPGSLSESSVELEITVPTASKQFFGLNYDSQVVPPSAEFSYIPSGTFLMCSPPSEVGRSTRENHLHEVTLTKGFFLKKHETTFGEWNAVNVWARANGYPNLGLETIDVEEVPTVFEIGQNGGRFLLEANGGNSRNVAESADMSGNQPVSSVNWYESINWLNAKSEMDGLTPCYKVILNAVNGGATVIYRDQTFDMLLNSPEAFVCDWDANGYRLPTEAEWEYACRGGALSAFSNNTNLSISGDGEIVDIDDPTAGPLEPNLDAIASYWGNGAATHAVGSKAPNAFGLFDMHGNVNEWTWDLFNQFLPVQFSGAPEVDPKGNEGSRATYRNFRGGGWRDPGKYLRAAARSGAPAIPSPDNMIGFRYAMNAPE